MTHYAPDPEPDPQPGSQSAAWPELFTLTFWMITVARVVRGAAVGGTAVLGAGHFDTFNAVPWNGYLAGCAVGALMSLGASLGGQLIPGLPAAQAVVARFTSGRAQ